MKDAFGININCIIFAVDIEKNKRYVLSVNEKEIAFPRLNVTKDLLNSSIEKELITFIKSMVFVNDLELIPQIICLHHPDVISADNSDSIEVNSVYGFLINHTNSIKDCYWIEFDFTKPIHYSNLLFETIQQLK
jgi:hypothetical protein